MTNIDLPSGTKFCRNECLELRIATLSESEGFPKGEDNKTPAQAIEFVLGNVRVYAITYYSLYFRFSNFVIVDSKGELIRIPTMCDVKL